MKTYTGFIILLLFFLGKGLTASGQNGWDLPADADEKKAPFAFTEESEAKGKDHYMQNCKSCHGIPGENNYIDLDPPPGDPATEKIQQNSDGVLYYKLKNGKGQMPAFGNVLTVNELWQVISFLRSFNDAYEQVVEKQTEGPGFKGEKLQIALSRKNDSIVQALVKALNQTPESPLKNAAVELLAKRYFGNLPIDGIKNTDEQGIAEFKIPEKLPGDSAGKIHFIARLQDQETYGTVETDTVLLAGAPTNKPSLTAERALWNDVTQTPLWLLFTYAVVVLAIWAFIFYIIYQLYLVRKLGA